MQSVTCWANKIQFCFMVLIFNPLCCKDSSCEQVDVLKSPCSVELKDQKTERAGCFSPPRLSLNTANMSETGYSRSPLPSPESRPAQLTTCFRSLCAVPAVEGRVRMRSFEWAGGSSSREVAAVWGGRCWWWLYRTWQHRTLAHTLCNCNKNYKQTAILTLDT